MRPEQIVSEIKTMLGVIIILMIILFAMDVSVTFQSERRIIEQINQHTDSLFIEYQKQVK